MFPYQKVVRSLTIPVQSPIRHMHRSEVQVATLLRNRIKRELLLFIGTCWLPVLWVVLPWICTSSYCTANAAVIQGPECLDSVGFLPLVLGLTSPFSLPVALHPLLSPFDFHYKIIRALYDRLVLLCSSGTVTQGLEQVGINGVLH